MAAVAMPADVSDLTGATFDADTDARVDRLLEMAEAVIAAQVPGIQFETLDHTTTPLVVPGSCDRVLDLPYTPLVSVTSVKIDAFELESWQYTHTASQLIRTSIVSGWSPYGWGSPFSNVTITGTFGPTGLDVAGVAAALVAQTMANPVGLLAESIEGRSATFTPGVSGMTLTKAQNRILDRYRPRQASPRFA